ncbi:hypothetical protein SXCC_00562 [Gluconacetobacter sp. SXCC-1]|nr:hypothetical protein SXCC_00562 [Gluconacetobacter sp. SXCC-1]
MRDVPNANKPVNTTRVNDSLVSVTYFHHRAPDQSRPGAFASVHGLPN